MRKMNIIEKRDFIHSHLHIADDGLINELYQKIQSGIKKKQMIVGFDAKGGEISANQFLKDLKEAELQIEKDDFLTMNEMDKEAENWK
jgi:hypothetical protein